jgi:lipoprotein LpqH
VTYGGKDTGLATAVGCATDDGLTTIVIAADLKTTVVLTDEQPPIVKSVGIGEGDDKPPALAYVQGVSGSAQASRDGLHYTITGTGMGTDPATGGPVTATFQITANCS